MFANFSYFKSGIIKINSISDIVRQLWGICVGRCFSMRAFLLCNAFCICFHHTNEGIVFKCFGINKLTVYNTSCRKIFADYNRVNIIHAVIFFRGIESFFLDELGNAPLHLCPGHLHINIHS